MPCRFPRFFTARYSLLLLKFHIPTLQQNYSHRPTGRVEIPPDYPVEKLFQNCRMWEEMLSVLIERFSGDTLLASQEVL